MKRILALSALLAAAACADPPPPPAVDMAKLIHGTPGDPNGYYAFRRVAIPQATEVAIAAEVLNRMLELGRPNYVRIA
jgi:hypothetical protein